MTALDPVDSTPDVHFDPALQCTARSKQSGQRCRRARTPGLEVCWYHGGASPQARRAAQRRLAKARAEGEIAALIEELDVDPDVPPHEVLIGAVRRAHSMARLLEALVGGLAPEPETEDGTKVEALYGPDHLGDARPHALVALFERWNTEAGRLGKLALDAGIEAERLRLDEAKLDLAAAVLLGTLRRLGHDPDAPLVQDALEATYREMGGAA